jgi:hypothetical protein
LIYIQERAGSPELIGGNHEWAASDVMRIVYIYTIRIMVSSINLNAQDIKAFNFFEGAEVGVRERAKALDICSETSATDARF